MFRAVLHPWRSRRTGARLGPVAGSSRAIATNSPALPEKTDCPGLGKIAQPRASHRQVPMLSVTGSDIADACQIPQRRRSHRHHRRPAGTGLRPCRSPPASSAPAPALGSAAPAVRAPGRTIIEQRRHFFARRLGKIFLIGHSRSAEMSVSDWPSTPGLAEIVPQQVIPPRPAISTIIAGQELEPRDCAGKPARRP